MGEIAEMTLDGTLCSVCGVYLGLDTGYPVQCHDCKKELRKEYSTRRPRNKKNRTVTLAQWGKQFTPAQKKKAREENKKYATNR